MKKFSRTIVAVSLGLGMAISAHAGTYTYLDQQVSLEIKDGVISSSHCEVKDSKVVASTCKKSEANIKSLLEKLESRIAESNKLLENSEKLLKTAKEIAVSDEAEFFTDASSGTEYVMLSLATGFNLPMDKGTVEKGDFSFVIAALTSHRDRYVRAVKALSSEEMPASFSSEKYSDVSAVLEVENVVRLAKYI